MAQALFDYFEAGLYDAATTNKSVYAYANGTTFPVGTRWGTATADDLLDDDLGDFVDSAATLKGAHDSLFTGDAGIQPTMHGDYHFRIWLIPSLLNLSNPTLGTNIPFQLWNTFLDPATLSSIVVTGSDVLTFDLVPSSTVLDFQYREVNLRIGEGEATIDASVAFNFDVGSGTLLVQAVVAETFPILPEVPVREQWEFKTDVLTNYLGIEQRIALMPEPRISLDFDVKVVDYEERRIFYDLMASNIKVRSLVPMFQYASPITQTTTIGGTRLYFDPVLTNLRVGGTLIALQRNTREIAVSKVVTLHADGATINAAVGVDVEANSLWFVVPAVGCYISDDSGLDFGTQAGTFTINADVLEIYDLQRPGATVTIDTFDSLPIIDKTFLITQPERFAYRREMMDGGVGIRSTRSRDTSMVVKRNFKFSVDRNSDEMDYWREFFALIVGGQKPFLASTQLPDLTLREVPAQGGSSLEINEGYYVQKLYPYDAFKRIRIQFENGDHSYHNVTDTQTDANGLVTLSIAPALTDDPEYTLISKISFLHKLRSSDKVRLEHYNDYSYVKFGARTTNN